MRAGRLLRQTFYTPAAAPVPPVQHIRLCSRFPVRRRELRTSSAKPAPSCRTRASFVQSSSPHQQSPRNISTSSPPTSQHRYPPRSRIHRLGGNLQAGSGFFFLVAPAVLGLLAFGLSLTLQPRPASDASYTDIFDDTIVDPGSMTTSAIPPGRPGNLTAEQEEKLRQLWAKIFHLFGVTGSGSQSDSKDDQSLATTESNGQPPSKAAEKAPKKKRTLFGRRSNKENEPEPATPTSTNMAIQETEDDKYGQTKQFYEAIANHGPEVLRNSMWSMVKHDHPDALCLRFLRARKWDVDKALVMLISTMNWRANEMHVDDDVMKHGEAEAHELEKKEGDPRQSMSADFLGQMRMGKSFLYGLDREGRPICEVRVRLHKQGEHGTESLERYTVYLIESARLMLKPPVDTATIIFDMTGFSMANMDYAPVKFMIKCFEANYPESLGTVLVYKAPWVFQGVWRIIRAWLDPVVASKIHFVNNVKDLDQFVGPERCIKELDGNTDWDYRYVEPIPGENDKMKDTATRDRLLASRDELVKAFESTTHEWINESDAEKITAIKSKREDIAAKMRESYWELDPYIRARSLMDRLGMIRPGGKIDMYSNEVVGAEKNGVESVTEGMADTSIADLD